MGHHVHKIFPLLLHPGPLAVGFLQHPQGKDPAAGHKQKTDEIYIFQLIHSGLPGMRLTADGQEIRGSIFLLETEKDFSLPAAAFPADFFPKLIFIQMPGKLLQIGAVFPFFPGFVSCFPGRKPKKAGPLVGCGILLFFRHIRIHPAPDQFFLHFAEKIPLRSRHGRRKGDGNGFFLIVLLQGIKLLPGFLPHLNPGRILPVPGQKNVKLILMEGIPHLYFPVLDLVPGQAGNLFFCQIVRQAFVSVLRPLLRDRPQHRLALHQQFPLLAIDSDGDQMIALAASQLLAV